MKTTSTITPACPVNVSDRYPWQGVHSSSFRAVPALVIVECTWCLFHLMGWQLPGICCTWAKVRQLNEMHHSFIQVHLVCLILSHLMPHDCFTAWEQTYIRTDLFPLSKNMHLRACRRRASTSSVLCSHWFTAAFPKL